MISNPSKNKSQIRLNKAIALAGICSRRNADELIAQGEIKVNGQIIRQLGTKINPQIDHIEVKNQAISISSSCDEPHIYIALYKPVQIIASCADTHNRKTVFQFLPYKLQKRRILPVGRLDFMSEGLLLFTTNGALIHRLTHPHWHIPKKYRVLVYGDITKEKLEKINQGMTLKEGEVLAPIQTKMQEDKISRKTWIEMTLTQGINRQIRRMCRDLNLTVLRLIRVQQGPIELGSLTPGKYRSLKDYEVNKLCSAVGLS